MQNISIDMIGKNDIKITIDGRDLSDITGFSLEIRVGETEKYSIEKNLSKQQNQIESIRKNKIKGENWRTIPEAIRELKTEDPKTAITNCSIRNLVKEEKISFIKDGRTTKIDLIELKEYYRNMGRISKLKQRGKIEPIF